jgi:hypothetical protein
MTTRDDVQAMLDKGNHPLVLVKEYIKQEDRAGAEIALELGSGPRGRLAGAQVVSLRRSIDARFPEIDEERKKRRGDDQKALREQLGATLQERRERRQERVALQSSKASRGPNATLPHISEEVAESEQKPVWGLTVRKDRRFS